MIFHNFRQYISVISLLFIFSSLLKAGTNDSLSIKLNSTTDSKAKVDIYLRIMETEKNFSENTYNTAVQLAKECGYQEGECRLYNMMGVHYRNIVEYDSAKKYHKKALVITEKTGNTMDKINTLNNLGVISRRMDDLYAGLDYHFKALKLSEKINDKKSIAVACNSIGNINMSLGSYSEAKKYFERSLAIETELNNTLGLAINYNNLGAVYENQTNYEKAIEYYIISLEKNKEIGSDKGIAINYNSIGTVYKKMQLYDNALRHYLLALEIDRKHSDKYYLSTTLINIGDIYLTLGKYAPALTNLTEAINIAREIGLKNILQEGYSKLAILYEQSDNSSKALEYHKLSEVYKDSILNEKNAKLLHEMNSKYEKDLNENQIANLEREKKYESLKFYLAFIGIAFVTTITLVLWYRNNRKKEFNKILLQKNQQIEETNNRLQEKNSQLSELNATKDKLFSIIGHDLKNPLHAINFTLETLINYGDRFEPEKLKKTYVSLTQSSKQLNDLLENLLNWARTQTGAINYQPEKIHLIELVDKAISIYKMNFEDKSITILNKVNKDIEVYADSNMLHTILRNLISNAIKFTNREGTIEVQTDEYEFNYKKYRKVSIKDSGIGIEKERIEKLFRIDHNISTPGTENEKGTGLGLILTEEFVDINRGRIWVESEPEKGTTFSFILPEEEE